MEALTVIGMVALGVFAFVLSFGLAMAAVFWIFQQLGCE